MSFFKEIKISDFAVALKNIINLLQRPLWINPTTGNIRLVETLTTVTTVSTVTTLTQVGGVAAIDAMINAPLEISWQMNVRNRIT